MPRSGPELPFLIVGAQSDVYGGILIRAIERVSDGKLFNGPCVSGIHIVPRVLLMSRILTLGERGLVAQLKVNRLLWHAGVKEVADLVALPSFDFDVANSGAQALHRSQLYLYFPTPEWRKRMGVHLLVSSPVFAKLTCGRSLTSWKRGSGSRTPGWA